MNSILIKKNKNNEGFWPAFVSVGQIFVNFIKMPTKMIDGLNCVFFLILFNKECIFFYFN